MKENIALYAQEQYKTITRTGCFILVSLSWLPLQKEQRGVEHDGNMSKQLQQNVINVIYYRL